MFDNSTSFILITPISSSNLTCVYALTHFLPFSLTSLRSELILFQLYNPTRLHWSDLLPFCFTIQPDPFPYVPPPFIVDSFSNNQSDSFPLIRLASISIWQCFAVQPVPFPYVLPPFWDASFSTRQFDSFPIDPTRFHLNLTMLRTIQQVFFHFILFRRRSESNFLFTFKRYVPLYNPTSSLPFPSRSLSFLTRYLFQIDNSTSFLLIRPISF